MSSPFVQIFRVPCNSIASICYISTHTHTLYIQRTRSNIALSCGFRSYIRRYACMIWICLCMCSAYIRNLNSNTDILFRLLHLLMFFFFKQKKNTQINCKFFSTVLNSKHNLTKFLLIQNHNTSFR